MTGRSPAHTRVILGATCYADAEGGLQIAVALAQQVRADLHGYLVADDEIMASVASPKARIVTYAGARAETVTSRSMHAAFHSDARLFQDRLAKAARLASLRMRFNEARGRLANLLSENASGGDLLVFGFRQVSRPSRRHDVVIIFGSGEPDPQLLTLGVELAGAQNVRLTLFADPAWHEGLRADVKALGLFRFEMIAVKTRADVLTRLETLSPTVVFAADSQADEPEIRRLIDAARCPVVVRFTRTETASQ